MNTINIATIARMPPLAAASALLDVLSPWAKLLYTPNAETV
jgi:hypothetical protein